MTLYENSQWHAPCYSSYTNVKRYIETGDRIQLNLKYMALDGAEKKLRRLS